MEIISIQKAYIRLDALLKLAGLAVTGGERGTVPAAGTQNPSGRYRFIRRKDVRRP
jgi:hypothetical protein